MARCGIKHNEKKNPNGACRSCSVHDHYKELYGYSMVEYLKLVEFQEGNCGICGLYFGEKLYIDHDHFSGEIRGLLCRSCNFGLGQFKDNPFVMKRAIRYLNQTIARNEVI